MGTVQKTLTFLIALAWTLTALSVKAESPRVYGPIQSGEMLWNIAAKVSPPSVSRQQVILALLKANPHAFSVPCNMNSLKVGQYLNVPNLSDMQALSQAEAKQEFNRQNEEWKARKRKPIICPPPQSATTTASTSSAASQPATTSSAANSQSSTPSSEDRSKDSEEQVKTSEPKSENGAKAVSSTDSESSKEDTRETEPEDTSETEVMVDDNQPQTPVIEPTSIESTSNQEIQPSAGSEESSLPLTKNNTTSDSSAPSPPSSPITMVLLSIVALLASLLIGWLFYRHDKPKPDNSLLESSFSKPIDEMPLSDSRPDQPPVNNHNQQ